MLQLELHCQNAGAACQEFRNETNGEFSAHGRTWSCLPIWNDSGGRYAYVSETYKSQSSLWYDSSACVIYGMAYAASKDKPSAFKYEPAAFKKLYPEQFYKQHIENGLRPDGRTFGRARPTTIGLDATATADSSALVKIGSTTVLAGIKLEVQLWHSIARPSKRVILQTIHSPSCHACKGYCGPYSSTRQ